MFPFGYRRPVAACLPVQDGRVGAVTSALSLWNSRVVLQAELICGLDRFWHRSAPCTRARIVHSLPQLPRTTERFRRPLQKCTHHAELLYVACSFYRTYVSSGEDTELIEHFGQADDNSRLHACIKQHHLGPVRAESQCSLGRGKTRGIRYGGIQLCPQVTLQS